MSRIIALLLVCLLCAIVAAKPPLAFRADGTFKIVQFTDLHFGDDTAEKDAKTTASQLKILTEEKPDLVLITGDVSSAWQWPNKQNGVANCWKIAVQPMVQLGIPWAMTFGNHDDQGNLNRDSIVTLDMSFDLSYTQRGPTNINGTTNYVVHVNGNNAAAAGIDLWFLDTHDAGGCNGHPGYGCIEEDQIKWFISTSRDPKRIKSQYGMMSVHIPPPEMMDLANLDQTTQSSTVGYHEEPINCPDFNTGYIDAVQHEGNVQLLIFGHDHNNDYAGIYKNITMAYGRKSGYGCYGPPQDMFAVGARVIQYHEVADDSMRNIRGAHYSYKFESWIRTFDGAVEKQQHEKTSQPIQKTCYY